MPTTVVGRFEFGMTRDGPKLLELNAETPTLIVELFRMNQQVCEDFGLESPNTLAEDELRDALLEAVEAGLRSVGARGGGNVVFTSYGDHQEDRETVQYLRRLLTCHCRARPSSPREVCARSTSCSIALSSEDVPRRLAYEQARR